MRMVMLATLFGGLRACNQEGGQQGNRTSGRTLGCAALPGGTSDIQMCPGVFLGVALKEAGCGDRAASRAADIRHVGKIRLQLFLIAIFDRHAPCGVARNFAGCEQFVGQRVVRIVIARE